jgi:hypothetical protein
MKPALFIYTALGLLMAAAVFAQATPPTKSSASQVMPAKRRQQIVSTARALFEPEVKNSLKVGRVKSPFSSTAL